MKYVFLCFVVAVSLSSVALADAQSENAACFALAQRYGFWPAGEDAVLLSSGELLLISGGPNNSLFVTRSRSDENGMHVSTNVSTGGSCNSSKSSSAAADYFETGFATISQDPSKRAQAQEVRRACANTSIFGPKIRSYDSLMNRGTSRSTTSH